MMQSCQEHDYAMEKPLRQLNPALHKRFILSLDPVEEDGLLQIKIVIEKMKRTLNDCRAAVCGRTSYTITQEDVSIEKHENSLSAESPRKKNLGGKTHENHFFQSPDRYQGRGECHQAV